jgi:RNA polymerase sigma factor (sigma-70 family)
MKDRKKREPNTEQKRKIRIVDLDEEAAKDHEGLVPGCGEKSPYRSFLDEYQEREAPLDNPDVLSEEDSYFKAHLSEDGREKLDLIKEILPTLTAQQQQVIRLCGEEGHTQREAAKIMGITQVAVVKLLNRARAIIKKAYNEVR